MITAVLAVALNAAAAPVLAMNEVEDFTNQLQRAGAAPAPEPKPPLRVAIEIVSYPWTLPIFFAGLGIFLTRRRWLAQLDRLQRYLRTPVRIREPAE